MKINFFENFSKIRYLSNWNYVNDNFMKIDFRIWEYISYQIKFSIKYFDENFKSSHCPITKCF